MMRLGILGGTFDPIQLAHLLGAEVVRESLNLQQVLFVPAGDPPHKQANPKSAATHRRAMVELAIATNPHFTLCPVDLERPGPHYSTDTVRLIRAKYKLAADDCFFIIGGDSLVDLPTWHQPETLLKLCRLAVVHRPGYRPHLADLEQTLPGLTTRLDWVEMPQMEISSSSIRARVRAGHSIRYQVPDNVRVYIEREKLYIGG
ncbi:MAG: nicotinate-nucleotide adenylyltransferase [Anaerolineae bacterium]|nr:nicotinate-nucleotide adenylyltransferase [Anaerolineae bacterium]